MVRTAPIRERFWTKVAPAESDEDCWIWQGATTAFGYGNFYVDGHLVMAHRVAYALEFGSLPSADLVLDHLCRNPPCVNPSHLEAVTQQTNILRGVAPAALRAAQTHCLRGHPFDATNTRYERNGTRGCKACHAMRERERKRALRANR